MWNFWTLDQSEQRFTLATENVLQGCCWYNLAYIVFYYLLNVTQASGRCVWSVIPAAHWLPLYPCWVYFSCWLLWRGVIRRAERRTRVSTDAGVQLKWLMKEEGETCEERLKESALILWYCVLLRSEQNGEGQKLVWFIFLELFVDVCEESHTLNVPHNLGLLSCFYCMSADFLYNFGIVSHCTEML